MNLSNMDVILNYVQPDKKIYDIKYINNILKNNKDTEKKFSEEQIRNFNAIADSIYEDKINDDL